MKLAKVLSGLLLLHLEGKGTVAQAADTEHVLEIHGAGTTNPSKCLWLLEQQVMDRTRVPVHMTYRAVGSSTGIFEFVGVNNTGDFAYKNYNDFGAADIPLPKEEYDALNSRGIEVVQLPFVLGSVGVFYNSLTDSDNELDTFEADKQPTVNLTACDLAKIFKREIKHWDHEDLRPNNPNLEKVLPSGLDNYPIHVARRVKGSSSTKSLATYLNSACPEEWPEDMVGTTVEWPDDTMPCEGSGGMEKCLVDTPGAIGYMESGHGWSKNFKEVELKNADGRFLTSRYAASVGGIGSAAGDVPDSADKDFSSVSLINKPGDNTWPITLMSYIFVRKDLSAWMDNDQEKTLLKAFLKGLYDEKIINQCEQFGFVPAPANVKNVALAGIEMLNVTGGEEWDYEFDTSKGGGAGRYTISAKRRRYNEVQISSLDETTSSNEEIVALWAQTNLDGASAEKSTSTARQTSQAATYTSDAAAKLNAALIMSAISIVLWCLLVIGLVAKRMCCYHAEVVQS